MTQRLIVHAGFHKTGTTSAQRTLDRYRKQLAPHVQVVLRKDMKGLCEAARRYSVSRDPVDLGFVKYEAALVLEGLDPAQPALLSSEDLSGHMPGRRKLRSYDAAPTIAAAMVDAWRQIWREPEITLTYSTRAPQPWLASCYIQHLRATRITMSAGDYAQAYENSANLSDIVSRVRDACPTVRIVSNALEDIGTDPLGPAHILLKQANVPADLIAQLPPLPRANEGLSPEQQAKYLALNQSDLTNAEVSQRKKASP